MLFVRYLIVFLASNLGQFSFRFPFEFIHTHIELKLVLYRINFICLKDLFIACIC